MDLIRETTISFRSYAEALKFIDKHKLWSIFIIPALCSLIIAGFVTWFALATSASVTEFAVIKFNLDADYEYMNSFLEFVVINFVRGAILLSYVKLYRYLVIIILSPEFAYITSIVQSKALDENHGFKLKRFISDIWRSVFLAVRNFLIELIITILIIIFAVIVTWIIPLIPILIFIFEAYFFGYSMADFRNEYMNISLRESKDMINDHKPLIIGNGILFNLSLLIPIFGVLFGPTLSLVAMGLSLNKVEHKKEYYAHSVHQSI